MFHSAVIYCLMLSIVQATGKIVKIVLCLLAFSDLAATTCAQQGTQDCDQNFITIACNALRRAGESVPLSCPPLVSSFILTHYTLNVSSITA